MQLMMRDAANCSSLQLERRLIYDAVVLERLGWWSINYGIRGEMRREYYVALLVMR